MSELVTVNPDRGIDFELRILGINDRAAWTIVAADNRSYVSDLVFGRPDWVLRHVSQPATYRVYEYKNRALGEGDATDYEKWQAIIYAVLVQDEHYRAHGRLPQVSAHILYADDQSLRVDYGDEEVEFIAAVAPEAAARMYFLGVNEEPKERIWASNLARFIVDPGFTDERFGRTAAQLAGRRAHARLVGVSRRLH